jgi:3-phenylpropionate/cinnamic acid dioxygenase small subunit
MSTILNLSRQDRIALRFDAEEFLYHEAEMLDDRRLDEWLDLLTDDIHYWMPIRRTTQAKETHLEFTKPGGVAFFDDDKSILTMRVQRLSVGRAWAEDPPSRTRHLITNVRVADINGDELTVHCNFQLYRTRLNSEEDSWTGRRVDVLRRINGELKLSKRHIFLDQTVILSQNLSSLF